FRKAFTDIYPNFILSYSFKTNYAPPLLSLVKENGCYAEVVSTMEYEMALQLGYHTNQIIFNGPVKSSDDIKKAVQNKSIVQLDSEYEVDLIRSIRSECPNMEICVGIRVNMEINTDSGKSAIQAGLHESRFGFTNESLQKVIPILINENVKIISLHGHTSSSNRIVENYQHIANRLLQVCKDFGLNDVKYIDLGGSFFGAAPAEIDVSRKPSYKDYAKGICETMCQDEWFREHKPFIVIEPGTSVVANVFELVAKVMQHKSVCEKDFVVVDADHFQVRTYLSNINCPYEMFSNNAEQAPITADVVGSTCMEVDKLASDLQLKHYTHGDYIVFKGVGAYRQNFTPVFIHPLAPIVERGQNDETRVIRKRQSVTSALKLLGY
ncbi:MAG: hypothetical protein MJY93_05515, partial [Fibrobacter sp.]|nr:hypothetical protein [Fibrobacter sp.]